MCRMLTVYQSLDEIKTVPRGFALGVFDGVHLGHLSLIRALRDSCSERNLRPCVFTFSYGDGYDFNDRRLDHNFLMTQAQKLDVFQREGVSEVFLIPLTHDFCDLSPFEFLDSVIAGKLGGRVLAIGEDGHFGRGGKGGADFLEDYAANHSLEPLVVPEVLLNGEKISSTRIREALKKGEVEDATRMMSRPFRLTGEVISGNRLGRRIGFPTANILYPQRRPSFGAAFTLLMSLQESHATRRSPMSARHRLLGGIRVNFWRNHMCSILMAISTDRSLK